MHTLGLVSTLWLATLFAYSASLKFVRYDHAAIAARPYRLIPRRAVAVVGYTLPWLEVATAGALLAADAHRFGAALSAVLGGAFAVLSIDALVRKVESSCGCTGSIDDRIGWDTVVRGVLIVLAAVVAISTKVSVTWPVAASAVAVSLTPALVLGCRRLLARRNWLTMQANLKQETDYMASLIATSTAGG